MTQIGFLVFPNITQLDLTGPLEVLAQMPGAEIHLVWKTRDAVRAAGSGLLLTPTSTFADCPQLDVICVPGGSGMNALLTDDETLAFVRRQAAGARYVTSVCTGALVLGAAGLLKGRRAATHWMSMEFLAAFGATPVAERVVIDGNVITGGGVTAGIDFALRVVAEMASEAVAKAIQLGIKYDPQPPFDSGHPRSADPAIVAKPRARRATPNAAGRWKRRRRRLELSAIFSTRVPDKRARQRERRSGTPVVCVRRGEPGPRIYAAHRKSGIADSRCAACPGNVKSPASSSAARSRPADWPCRRTPSSPGRRTSRSVSGWFAPARPSRDSAR